MNKRESGFEPINNEWIKPVCHNPSHYPPTHLYIPAGQQYRHVCPGCGEETIVQASTASWSGTSKSIISVNLSTSMIAGRQD